ncbi:hypothetical protein RFI_38549, partial [Reticulomyxa filosa]
LFGTKEEVIWQLQTFNCISKPMQDLLSSEKNSECLSTGVYAIVSLKDAFLKLDKTPKELELMSKSSNVDIVLFFWPDTDSFADIKRGNASSLFLRVLLEVCSTVCMKVSQSELDNFYVDKQTTQEKLNEEEQSMGGGIQVGMKEEQKNDVSYNVEKMKSFPIEKERKQESSNGSVISKRAFVIQGAQSTIICHYSIQEHITELKPFQFAYSSEEELMNYIKQITQTHRLKLWDETFDRWEKACMFTKAICPELIEVPTFLFCFEFNEQLRLINGEYQEKISTVQSKAQQLWDSQKLELEFEYGNIFAYKCKNRNIAEMREIAKVLSDEKVNSFFSVSCSNLSASPSKKDFDNGVVALTKFIPSNASYHLLADNNIFEDLDSEVEKLYKWYQTDLSKVEESKKKKKEQSKGKKTTKEKQGKIENENNNLKSDDERRHATNENKNNQQSNGKTWLRSNLNSFKQKISWLSSDTQLTEEDKEEIKNRLARYDYTPFQIKCIAGFGQLYVRYQQIFLSGNPIKSVPSQEEELKKKYNDDRSQRDLELNKISLKKLDEKMNNGNPLSY